MCCHWNALLGEAAVAAAAVPLSTTHTNCATCGTTAASHAQGTAPQVPAASCLQVVVACQQLIAPSTSCSSLKLRLKSFHAEHVQPESSLSRGQPGSAAGMPSKGLVRAQPCRTTTQQTETRQLRWLLRLVGYGEMVGLVGLWGAAESLMLPSTAACGDQATASLIVSVDPLLTISLGSGRWNCLHSFTAVAAGLSSGSWFGGGGPGSVNCAWQSTLSCPA